MGKMLSPVNAWTEMRGYIYIYILTQARWKSEWYTVSEYPAPYRVHVEYTISSASTSALNGEVISVTDNFEIDPH